MEESKFREVVELLKVRNEEEIVNAKSSTLDLIGGLYENRDQASDEIKRTILHFNAADIHRGKRIREIDSELVPEYQQKVQQQLDSFFKMGKNTSVRSMNRILKEKDYLLRSRKEHTLRVKQASKKLIGIYGEIAKAEEHYDLLVESEHVRSFLNQHGLSAGMLGLANIDRWGREFVRTGGARRV